MNTARTHTTPAAIVEAADYHAAALADWHRAMLVRRQLRAELTEAAQKADIAGKKLRDAATNYERLMGAANEGE